MRISLCPTGCRTEPVCCRSDGFDGKPQELPPLLFSRVNILTVCKRASLRKLLLTMRSQILVDETYSPAGWVPLYRELLNALK